jgi:hypothetical protein
MAYRTGIDLSQYNYFIILRNADFFNFDCGDYGRGGYISGDGAYYPYEGGALTEVGTSTITYPFPFNLGSLESPGRTVHEFLHGYDRGTAHSTELICFNDPQNPDTTRVPYHYVGNESVLTSPYCQRGKGSWNDVMGGALLAEYLEVNSILKQQYRWITPKQIATVNGSALSAGQTITLKPIETPAAPKETQSVVIPIPGTTKAYVLEVRGGPVYSGVGVYVYLAPAWYKTKLEPYQEQYLLHIGDDYIYDEGPPYPQVPLPAPLKQGQSIIDPKMKLTVTIISASSTGAVLRVFTAP